MKRCPDCRTDNMDFNDYCSKCGADLKPKVYDTSAKYEKEHSTSIDKPNVCYVLLIISWLSLIGGIVGAISVFRNDGFQINYMPAVSFIVGGLITAVLFWALSEVISLLYCINRNMDTSNKKSSNSFQKTVV